MNKFIAAGVGSLIGACVAVLIGWAIGIGPLATVAAADERSLHVNAMVGVYEGDVGDECMPFGFVDPERDIWPSWHQLIITNDVGAVVGVIDLPVGKIEKRSAGQLVCVVSADLAIADSPFYTFTVDGKYKLTVSRARLEHNEWVHEAFMG